VISEEGMSRYGYPEVGLVVEQYGGGENVITKLDASSDWPISLSGGIGYSMQAWGTLVAPRGVQRLSSTWKEPDPAWGRKGPLVPPMVGMMIEVFDERPCQSVPRGRHQVERLSTAMGLGFIHLVSGYSLDIDHWGNAGMRIVKLPDDFTWPVKADVAVVATKDTLSGASLEAWRLSGDLSGHYPLNRAALTVTAQPSLPTLIALPSLFLLIGDCRVEFRRDGAILVNDRPVGSDRETCELFAEFARVQSQGGDGEVSFDREKILATLRENERLRERLGALEAHCRTLEGALGDGMKK
jgi:hypothetical protein